MSTTSKSIYWKGVRDGVPFVFMVVPFAMLFGVVAAEAGLNVTEALVFSMAVFAGASQFTALQMLQDNTPTVIVLISALAVNLRMAMYSASLTPHIGASPLWMRAVAAYITVDQSYACASVAFERHKDWSPRNKVFYLMGVVTPIGPLWYIMTYVGALVGSAIPPEYALDFALPIAFIAMIAPMLRSLPHLIAAFVAVTASLVLAGMPFNLGLLVSALVGMMAGAQAELWVARRSDLHRGAGA